MYIDLHIHSNYSDGTMTPEELVKMAKLKMLKAVSITDHDTMDGTDDALAAGLKHGVEIIPGIEISVEHDGTYMHLLGYCCDHCDRNLLEALRVVQEARTTRNEKIVRKLIEADIVINIEELQELSQLGQTGRPHIAQLLIRKKVVKNMNEAFDKYLKRGAAAYVHRFIYSARDAIKMIKNAGGLAVLAHPVQIDPTLSKVREVVSDLSRLGLDGIETYYPTHSKKVRKELGKLADKHGLLLTGGSDYHGDIRSGTSLAGGKNIHVPYSVVGEMRERCAGKC